MREFGLCVQWTGAWIVATVDSDFNNYCAYRHEVIIRKVRKKKDASAALHDAAQRQG